MHVEFQGGSPPTGRFLSTLQIAVRDFLPIHYKFLPHLRCAMCKSPIPAHGVPNLGRLLPRRDLKMSSKILVFTNHSNISRLRPQQSNSRTSIELLREMFTLL